MHRFPLFIIIMVTLLLVPLFYGTAQGQPRAALAEQNMLWLRPFGEGQPIEELLPEGIEVSDFATLFDTLNGQELVLAVLSGGGPGFERVALGIYDKKRRDVDALWTSDMTEALPFVLDNVDLEEIFIKYSYEPGDKYVSSSLRLTSASFGPLNANFKAFRAWRDLDYAGYSIKAGDFIIAGDAGGGGTLSESCAGNYSDLLFVLRGAPEPLFPWYYAAWGLGAAMAIGAFWGVYRGRKGLSGKI